MPQERCSVKLDYAVQHLNKGNYNQAESIANNVLALSPGNPNALSVLGAIAAQRHDYVKAKTFFLEAIDNAPNHAGLHSNIGNVYSAMGEIENAIQSYKNAIKIDPNLPDAYNNLGIAYRNQNKLGDAIDCFNKAINLNPVSAMTFCNLGSAQQSYGDLDAAIKAFEATLRIQPDMVAALVSLGSVYQAKGDVNNAILAFKRAKELDSDNVQANYLLSAITGDKNSGFSSEYARILFDGYAENFDHSLKDVLGYRTPEILRNCVNLIIGCNPTFNKVLDLGCGTGLSGVEFRDISKILIGVDISKKMIEKAEKKEIYNDLVVSDITEYIKAIKDNQVNLVIAADVFVYMGDIDKVFSGVSSCLSDGGFFIFSVEHTEANGYEIRPSGRFAHSINYIELLSEAYNFNVLHSQHVRLRKDKNEWIYGDVFILQSR